MDPPFLVAFFGQTGQLLVILSDFDFIFTALFSVVSPIQIFVTLVF